MNQAKQIAVALAQIPGVASVTRGWPAQTAKLPCIAVALEEQTAADTRDNAVYLTRHSYAVRIFANTMDAADTLAEGVAAVMDALGYTLERALEIDSEIAQQKMIYHTLE